MQIYKPIMYFYCKRSNDYGVLQNAHRTGLAAAVCGTIHIY